LPRSVAGSPEGRRLVLSYRDFQRIIHFSYRIVQSWLINRLI